MSVFYQNKRKFIVLGVLGILGVVCVLSTAEDKATSSVSAAVSSSKNMGEQPKIVTHFDSHDVQIKSNHLAISNGTPVQMADAGKMDQNGRVIPPALPSVHTIVYPGLSPDETARGMRAHRHPEGIHPEWEHVGDSVNRKE